MTAREHRIAFTEDENRPGKADYTGAFRPEAHRYAGPELTFAEPNESARAERAYIEALIREHRPTEVGFFCHGLSRSIELGYRVDTVRSLADALAEVGCARVALHACLTGKDPVSGFAARLRDAMASRGLSPLVLGSTTAGHAARNPHRRLFTAPVGSPGEWIVEPGSAQWKAWRRRMRDGTDSLRHDLLSYGSVAAIRAALW